MPLKAVVNWTSNDSVSIVDIEEIPVEDRFEKVLTRVRWSKSAEPEPALVVKISSKWFSHCSLSDSISVNASVLPCCLNLVDPATIRTCPDCVWTPITALNAVVDFITKSCPTYLWDLQTKRCYLLTYFYPNLSMSQPRVLSPRSHVLNLTS